MKLLNSQIWGDYSCISPNRLKRISFRIPILLALFFKIPCLALANPPTYLLDDFVAPAIISGMVQDVAGNPLSGASVIIKGTSSGTLTNPDGSYSVDAAYDDVLVFSYIGFSSKEIPINNQTKIDVVLEEEEADVDEIVIVGYGTQKKSDLTGSITSINGTEIQSIIAGNPTSALQGKLPGVQIENNGGEPGGTANVFVRGISSLTNSFPLYVIDGTFADNMNFVNPKDIDRIEVLKDASSAAIYGSRAANGVVIITTKRGKAGTTQVNLDMRSGIETPSRMLDLLNGPEFVEYRRQREINDNTGFVLDPTVATYDTDWQDLTLNTGVVHDYGVSVSGGGANSRYFLSGNYYSQEGILVSTGFERYNLRANSEFILGRFKIQESLGVTQGEIERNNWFGRDGATAPILRENVPDNEGGFEAPNFSTHGFAGVNQFGLASLEENHETNNVIFGNLNLSYEIFYGFTAKLNLGAELINRHNFSFRPTFFMSSSDPVDNVNQQNDLTDIRAENLLTLIEPTLNYTTEFEAGSRIDAIIGLTQQRIDFRSVGVYAQDLPNNDIQVIGAAIPDNVQALLGEEVVSVLRSAFGRLNYVFRDRYLFSATVRRDASSKFASDFRVGYFPSASLGWKVSSEPFWNSTTISTLKFRAGYGELGSQNIPDYSYQSVFNLNSATSVNNEIVQGYAQTSLALEDIQWETAKTLNIGIDLGLWDNKLTLSAEYYNKDVEDVLVGVAPPASVGIRDPIIQNIGEINNTGIEIDALYRYAGINDFNWNLGINFSTFNSEIVSLPNPIVGPSITEDLVRVNRFAEGEAPGLFYGFIVDGVYPDQAAIDSDPNIANDPIRRSAVQPGDFIRRDITGDGMVNGEDQTTLGDPTPDFIYGINLTGNFRGLDFALFFQGVYGNEIYNVQRYYNIFWADDNKLDEIKNAWTPNNRITNIPRTTTIDRANNGAPSSFFVEDGSYFRLRTAELGYTFLTEGIPWLQNLRFFVTGQNIFILTDYSGYSPDISSVNGGRSSNSAFFGAPSNVNPLLGRGLDVRAYPNSTSLILGVQAAF
ncbi:MAG: TonB-dependent receptor [Bacteroidota bacterium]